MLLQWPDLYYHTSMDTIDKVSEDSLKRVGWITTVAVLTLANATTEEAFLLASQTVSKGMVRLHEAGLEAVEELIAKRNEQIKSKKAILARELAMTALHYRNKIRHIVWRETQAVKSVSRLAESPELEANLDKHCRSIIESGKRETARLEEALNFIAHASKLTIPTKLEETKAEKDLKRLIPKKLFKGTLSSDELRRMLGQREYEWYDLISEKDLDFGRKMLEIVNFMDGKRNAYDIAAAVSAEYGPTQLEHVRKFLKDLKKAKLATLKQRS
jgi:hypothetical protein